jgi:hypothetical protein
MRMLFISREAKAARFRESLLTSPEVKATPLRESWLECLTSKQSPERGTSVRARPTVSCRCPTGAGVVSGSFARIAARGER